MAIHTTHDLPARPSPSRSCPNMRTCWPGLTLASFNPFVSDPPLMLRRICMLGILGIRTFNSVLITLSHGMGPSIIPSILLGILFFFFIAYSLHLIGEMQGTRRVFRVSWGKWHFDAFLAITFLIHVGFVGGYYVGMPGTVLSALWMTMGLLIFVVSWIAWWEPESEASLPR